MVYWCLYQCVVVIVVLFTLCSDEQNVVLPEPGKYATGILFVGKDPDKTAAVEKAFEQLAQQAKLQVCLLMFMHIMYICII